MSDGVDELFLFLLNDFSVDGIVFQVFVRTVSLAPGKNVLVAKRTVFFDKMRRNFCIQVDFNFLNDRENGLTQFFVKPDSIMDVLKRAAESAKRFGIADETICTKMIDDCLLLFGWSKIIDVELFDQV